MTKKSNNRKFKLGETPMRYRELIIPVPLPVYERLLRVQTDTLEKGLIPAQMTPREFALLCMANGVALAEADLHNRERQGALVVTPDEAKDVAERLQRAKRGHQ